MLLAFAPMGMEWVVIVLITLMLGMPLVAIFLIVRFIARTSGRDRAAGEIEQLRRRVEELERQMNRPHEER